MLRNLGRCSSIMVVANLGRFGLFCIFVRGSIFEGSAGNPKVLGRGVDGRWNVFGACLLRYNCFKGLQGSQTNQFVEVFVGVVLGWGVGERWNVFGIGVCRAI